MTPTPINDGNPTCGDFNAAWTELKVQPPGNGVFTDGTLTVTIANFANSNSGTPGSFDWSSNIGVDAVFVKAGNDKHDRGNGKQDRGRPADRGKGKPGKQDRNDAVKKIQDGDFLLAWDAQPTEALRQV